jgi:hypothetical protein
MIVRAERDLQPLASEQLCPWTRGALSGEIDVSAPGALTRLLAVIELPCVEFIDICCIKAFVRACNHLRSGGREFLLRCAPRLLLRMVDICRLTDTVEPPGEQRYASLHAGRYVEQCVLAESM